MPLKKDGPASLATTGTEKLKRTALLHPSDCQCKPVPDIASDELRRTSPETICLTLRLVTKPPGAIRRLRALELLHDCDALHLVGTPPEPRA